MPKLTILLHPEGKFWATHEVNGRAELVFGNASSQTQIHPLGYTKKRLPEKLRKGYVALLDQATVPDDLSLDLEAVAKDCRLFVQWRTELPGAFGPVFARIGTAEQRRFIQNAREHFALPAGVAEKLAQSIRPEIRSKLSHSPISSATNAVTAEIKPGPWAW